MKILFVAETFPPTIGGVAQSARRISGQLAALGHDVHVLTFVRALPGGAVETEKLAERLTVHRFGAARHLDFTLQHATNFLEWLDSRGRFDLLWGHYAQTAGFLAAWLGKRWGRKSILAVRGNDLDRGLFPPGDFARLRWCLETATTVATVSRELAAKVTTLVDRPAISLPNAVDSEVFAPGERDPALVAEYRIQPDELVLVFSGELRAKKGLSFLLQAVRDLVARRPTRLLVVGEVRPHDQGEFQRLAAADPAAGRAILVTGRIDEPAEVARRLRLADAFVLPSLWEGMPNGLLEAMAAGVPVVASNAGAIPEIVTDGEHGLLVPKTHLHQLAQRIEELLAFARPRRDSLIRAARHRVLTEFSLEAERTNLSRLLEATFA